MEERRKGERRKNAKDSVLLPAGIKKDRRKRQRRASLPEKILVLNDSVASSTLHARVVDVSESGVGLFSETPIKVGQVIKFLQRRRKTDFPAQGVIVWTMKKADGFRAGVMFSNSL